MIDGKLIFDEAAAVTTDRVSTNILDLGEIEEAGRGAPKYLNIEVVTGFTSSAETLAVNLISAAGAEPDAADIVQGVVPPIAASEMVAGKILAKVPLPSEGLEDHVGLSYDTSDVLAEGTINAYITLT